MKVEDVLAMPEVDRLFSALCLVETTDEARAVMLDLCSPGEICDLAQRFEMARLLDRGASYLEVSDKTGASSTTVSRVSKCLNGEVGGYRLLLDRYKSATAE